jgi:hypothetical protein
MRFVFLAGYGLLPLWAAIAFIAFGFMTMRSDYAGMTLWSLVVAVPACAVTLLVANVGVAIYSRAAGDRWRKLRLSVGFVLLANVGIVLAGVLLWLNKRENDEYVQAEKALVEQFTRSNTTVREAAGEPITVSINSYTFHKSGPLPVQYDVSVSGLRTVYAIVEVDRTSKPPAFRLLCTTPLYMGQRDPLKSPCAQ